MSDLIPSISLPGLLAERQARIDAARAVMSDPEKKEFAQYLLRPNGYGCDLNQTYLEDYISHVDRNCWNKFIKASGLWDLFPRERREDWEKALRQGDHYYRHLNEPCPEFTAEAAMATWQTYVEQRSDLRKEALLALFKRLSWDHATNQPALFGEKLIYKWFANRYTGRVCNDSNNTLDDLLRELYRLDGKPEPVGIWYQNGKTDGYFQVKTFKNGNAHIMLERPDLVDKLNAQLAHYCPGALPAPSKVKRKRAA